MHNNKKVDTSKVSIGCYVTLYDKTFDEEVKYKIVGSTESDPKQGLISNESPVGRAVLGKVIGDEVNVETPNGILNFVVKNISLK